MSEPAGIFVSHSHLDNEFGLHLATSLRQALGSEDSVWYDAYGGLRGGDDWWDTIIAELTNRPVFIVLLSPAAMQSKWVQTEFKIAFQQSHETSGKRIIPVLYQRCELRADMKLFQWVNFVDKSYEEAFNDLLTALEKHASVPQMNTPATFAVEEIAPIPVPTNDFIGSTSLPPDQFPDHLVKLGFMPRVRGETIFIYPPWQPVPTGGFLMGSDPSADPSTSADEMPQHQVFLDAFDIGRYPVTVAEYRWFIRAGHRAPDNWSRQIEHLDSPVRYISWYDARAYSNWLAGLTREDIRLPTEAEWEKTARGTDGRLYPWGNEFDASRSDTTKPLGRQITEPVGGYPNGASPFGVQDIVSKVWEWTSSLPYPYPYSAVDGRERGDARGPRVMRGGAYDIEAIYARVARRSSGAGRGDTYGFRLARSVR